MDKQQHFVLLQWMKDQGFPWSILPRRDVYTSKELQVRMAVKAKWKSSRLDAKVLAWDGEFMSSGL